MPQELVKVYDPKGEMFEVQHELGATLVLNKGWSKNPPGGVSAAPEPVSEPEHEVAVEERASE